MENRPNIITVGALGGTLATMLIWVYHSFWPHMPPMTPEMVSAVTIAFTALAQYIDRLSKRAHNHVLTKYGDKKDGE